MFDPVNPPTPNISVSTSHEAALRRIRDIPSLPEVVNKIIHLLGEPNTPASEIAKLISYDPGLTSKVLRMVNSAAYGFQRQISSIQHGIMILGFNTVRGLVLSASIFKMFEGRQKGLDHQKFWEHSLGTAIAAQLAGKQLGLVDMDDAFSAGMLHDIGKVVLDVYFASEYQRVLSEARLQGLPCHGAAFLQLEQRILKTTHTSIGGVLASKWKLPLTITEVIQHHHHPEKSKSSEALVYLVALANRLSMVLAQYDGVVDETQFPPNVLAYFDLNAEDLTYFLEALREEMETAEAMLGSIAHPS